MTKLPTLVQLVVIFAAERVEEIALYGLDKLAIALPDIIIAGDEPPDDDFHDQLASIDFDFTERPNLPIV